MDRDTKRYVVVPNDSVFSGILHTKSFTLLSNMRPVAALGRGRGFGSKRIVTEAGEVTVIDSIDLNEATLVEMGRDQAEAFSKLYPSLRLQRELFLYPLRFTPARVGLKSARLPVKTVINSVKVRCVCSVTGAPVPNAEIIIVLNGRTGSAIMDKQTDANGAFSSALPKTQKVIDRIICHPLAGFWPAELGETTVPANGLVDVEVKVVPIDPNVDDALTDSVQPALPNDGLGVRVAIIDAGTDSAPGLNVTGGANTTLQEPASLFSDSGIGHGTHVAGIVARVAPKAELYVYRVFEAGAKGASEFAIAKAIRQAVDDGCDIINLSLGQPNEPISITREARRARSLGVVCVCAAGNEAGEVLYPARSANNIAVSAFGVDNTWPQGARTGVNKAEVPAPVGKRFFANFSNTGESIDFIAAGVGIRSWVNSTQYGIMDGTSMASPVVAGLLARLLSRDVGLLKQSRDQQRSDDIIKAGYLAATKIGFGPDFEGSGAVELK